MLLLLLLQICEKKFDALGETSSGQINELMVARLFCCQSVAFGVYDHFASPESSSSSCENC